MKYIVWTLLCVFLVACFAAADTLKVSYVNYSFGANSDTPYNADFSFQGPQVSLNGSMTTCRLSEFCFGYPEFFLPGTFVVPHATVGYNLTMSRMPREASYLAEKPTPQTLFDSPRHRLRESGFYFPRAGKRIQHFP